MKATVSTSGRQIRLRQGEVLVVDRVKADPGSQIVYDDVLLVEEDDKVTVGTPKIDGATVTAEVLEHFRGKKVRVFKMRRRKKYRVSRGHRSELSKIRVSSISLGQSGVFDGT